MSWHDYFEPEQRHIIHAPTTPIQHLTPKVVAAALIFAAKHALKSRYPKDMHASIDAAWLQATKGGGPLHGLYTELTTRISHSVSMIDYETGSNLQHAASWLDHRVLELKEWINHKA